MSPAEVGKQVFFVNIFTRESNLCADFVRADIQNACSEFTLRLCGILGMYVAKIYNVHIFHRQLTTLHRRIYLVIEDINEDKQYLPWNMFIYSLDCWVPRQI